MPAHQMPALSVPPEPLGVEREGGPEDEGADAVFFGFRGVLLLVEFCNPAGALFCLLEVEEPGVQDAACS